MATKKATSTKPAAGKTGAALTKTDPNLKLKLPAAAVDVDDLLEQQAPASETMDASDLQIPRIGILQSGSPQVKKGEGAYIKGAEEGDFYDNVANAVFAKSDEGFLFVPVTHKHHFVEWKTRKQGGGFVNDHGNNPSVLRNTTRNDDGQMITPSGTEIVETITYFGYVVGLDELNPRQVVVSMAKTQLKYAKRLNSCVSALMFDSKKTPGKKYNPPMFASAFMATTLPQTNDKGSWMVWNLVRLKDTAELKCGERLIQDAIQFQKSVIAGDVKVADPIDAEPIPAAGSPDDGATL